MREYTVNDNIVAQLKQVLDKENIKYIISDGIIKSDVSGAKFHKLIIQAYCLKQQKYPEVFAILNNNNGQTKKNKKTSIFDLQLFWSIIEESHEKYDPFV